MEGGGEGMWGKERMGREESIDRSRYGMCGEGRPADIGVEGRFRDRVCRSEGESGRCRGCV